MDLTPAESPVNLASEPPQPHKPMILNTYNGACYARAGAVQVKIAKTVLLLLAPGLVLGCSRPSTEHPVEPPARVAAPSPSPTGAPLALASTPPTQPTATAVSGSAAESTTGSAYFGCGEPIPVAKLWDETTESQVFEAIGAAKACAAEHGRRLLLEFVAPWCEDCQEMARLDETALVAATLKERFERVRVNVGKWDHHEGLRSTFDVHALATYIVIDPKTSKQLAKTTLEPITKKGQRISAEQWAAWLNAH